MLKKYSSFLNENENVFSSESIASSTVNDSLFFGSCIAISPDSKQIVIFSPETHEFELYNIDNLSSSKSISTLECGVNDKHLCWSIAISNCVDNGKNERFIALSCFDAREFCNDIKYVDDESDLESGDQYLRPQTWVISTTDVNEIYTSSIGGVIRFLDSNDNLLKNKTVIIIVNASGIYKETMNNIKRQRFFSRSSNIERFELPHQLSIRLHLSREHWHNSLELLYTSIIKNHFMVHSFENRKQIIEMYSLITGDLEMLFKRHESTVAPNIIRGFPIFAISQNEKILAFCRGTTSITLYSMDNGLETASKQLEGQRGIYKIAAINFIDNDSKLLIVLEENEYKQVEILKCQIFVVWDLFTTYENSIRKINYSEPLNPLKMDITHRLMNSHGSMFAVRDSGEIFSVLDHKDVALIRYSSGKAITEIDITTSDTVYLDSKESTQLIIKGDTIQVWKYSNTIVKRDRVLKYIWAQKIAMDVQELRIGEREFVLKVSVPSTKFFTSPKSIMIHWPNNVNVLEGACRALYVLEEKKHIVAGQENVNQIKYLIECTQRLVRKYITKYGIFRLTSIRYPIMKYLIKSYQESLIKHILNVKINNKHSNIYIPRLYKWADENNNRSTKSDLHHAILCIQKRGDATVILKYLIDYYTANTKKYNNYGWMFTVSKAIPLLYDYHLSGFVQDLLKKLCFGITEAYTPPLHINQHDQRKGNNASVIHSLAVKPCLVSKPIRAFLQKQSEKIKNLETSHNDRKVYIVPLPGFTVYPDPEDSEPQVINDTKQMSPFIRVIHEEKGDEIFQTPTIMAVLDFKWPAAQILQLKREGWYRYMNNSNMFGLGSVLLPLANSIVRFLYGHQVLVLQFSVFNSVSALTALVMWLELVGRFVYIIMNILNTVWPFFAFMLSALLAFGHAMFIALKYADNPTPQFPTYKIKDTSNSDLYSNITIYQNVNNSYRLDNYYSRLVSSVKVVFFWTNGRWDQLDQWDNYAVNVISILGTNKESRIAAQIYRAELVAEYETLEKPFDNNSSYSKKYRDIQNKGSSNVIKNNETINKISFIDEESFPLKVVTSKPRKKSQRNCKSDNKSLEDVSYNNESSDESSSEDNPCLTTNINKSSMQERFNNLENEFKKFKDYIETLETLT
ncbi:8001_t:CDS:10 [Diversispora eburnea]|uniref:8001_t:CDS:1 n=1 Tax=Diversispora eburnea TaxID=1213867 RepID=A0A9N8YXS1_9GLOM|nr:8001_t:CDS:10 [Diversispora eburnea]